MEQIHTSNNWIFVASARDRHFNKIVSKAKSVPAEQYRSLRYYKLNREGDYSWLRNEVNVNEIVGNLLCVE